MAVIKTENRVGAMMHPCWTPVSTVKGSDMELLLLSTVAVIPSCISLSILMYLYGQPYLNSIVHRAC